MEHLTVQERLNGLYAVGRPGSGKSTLLENLIVQDILAGYGVGVLDPHRDLIDRVIARTPEKHRDRIILLNLRDAEFPFGLNLYECADPSDPLVVEEAISPIMQIFERLWGPSSPLPAWGTRMERFLYNTAAVLAANDGATMAEVPILLDPKNEGPRRTLLRQVRNPDVLRFWREFENYSESQQRELVESTSSKVDSFLARTLVKNIVGQSKTTVDIKTIMANSGVLLVKLDPGLVEASSLIGTMLVSRILNEATARLGQAERPPFFLYADECQRFATPDFARLLSEGRKLGVGVTPAHQFRDQLTDSANRGASANTPNQIIFQVSGKDALEVAGNFDATPPPREITGYRPILRPHPEPIKSLMKAPHANPEVRRFFDEYIRPLVARAESSRPIRSIEGSMGAAISSEGERYLAEIMTGNSSVDRLIDLLLRAARLYVVGEEPGEGLSGLWKTFLRELHDGKVGEPQLKAVLVALCRRHHLRTAASCREQAAYAQQHKGDYIEGQTYDEWQRSIPRRSVEADARSAELLAKAKAYEHGELIDEHVEQYEEKLMASSVEIAQLLTTLGRMLRAEPIMEQTGQFDPIYELPRTVADVQNMVANELTQLAPMTAKAKLGSWQGVITIDRQEVDVSPAVLQEVRDRSRFQVGRSRRSVEEEIENRQKQILDGTWGRGGALYDDPPTRVGN